MKKLWKISFFILAMVWSGGVRAARVEVPVDIGVGPAFYLMNNPIFLDQPIHFGLKISVAAVINRSLLRRFRHRIPRRYRRALRNTREIKYSPLILGLIPDSLIISPKIKNTQIYGITFRPLALGLGINVGSMGISLKGGLLLTYFFLQSDQMLGKSMSMHFLRPGLELKLEFEIPFSERFLISFGWASQFYIPQSAGAQFWEAFGPFETWIWHLGQIFLQFHFRFPYEVNLK